MVDDSDKDIQVVTVLESIRLRSWMYLRHPREPLREILGILTDSFIHLKITEFTIHQEPSFYIIKSKQDWLNQNNNEEFAYYFDGALNIKGSMNAAVFLTAFYFPFYTIGNAGEYGNSELHNECSDKNINKELEHYGRILIISKEQQLPKDHGINFERPERTISELVNERNWLDLSIQQARLNE